MCTMNEIGNKSNTSTGRVSSDDTPLPPLGVSACINTNSQQGAGHEVVKARDVRLRSMGLGQIAGVQ